MAKILILPGDGVGKEIIEQAIKIIDTLKNDYKLDVDYEIGLIGGDAYDKKGSPLPSETLNLAKKSDAILLGAVGGYKWNNLTRKLRPERGLLGLREKLDLFSNLRPAVLYPQLASASTLKSDIVAGLDLMIVRELTSGIYFGEPRGIRIENKEKIGFNTLEYKESEIRRIAHSAFKIASKRNKKLCSVDKANVLEVSELWREVVIDVQKEYPEVELTHMYVDNAAMQLIREPKQFDVIVTTNMFGDILSDCAAMLTGSIGMLPSASLDSRGFGMYEPIHGSAPDIADTNTANPIATILSLAMMFRYSLNMQGFASKIENSVNLVLDKGYRTKDIAYNDDFVTTSTMGDAVVQALKEL